MSNEFTIQSEAQVTNIKNRQATKDIVTDIVSNIQNDLVNTDEINNKDYTGYYDLAVAKDYKLVIIIGIILICVGIVVSLTFYINHIIVHR